MKSQLATLKEIAAKLVGTGQTQISLTDPDSRSMMTRGSGIVGYNVQTAVDTKHHLIVEHQVTNNGSDRDQLSGMAKKARAAIGTTTLTVIADRGYFKGEEILACHEVGISALVPPTKTSGAKADGRFDKADFLYDPHKNEYRCPARRIPDMAFRKRRKGNAAASVLELELQGLPPQGQVHAECAAASVPLGASGRARRDAEAP